MLESEVEDALNEQINAEFYAEYLYLAMAAYFEAEGFAGFGAWMRAQAAEERAHAMRIYDFVLDRDGRVTLEAIDSPPAEWDGPTAAFEAAHEHEVHVSRLIDDLVAVAREAGDNATETMLQWFVEEQVEEEATTQAIVDRLHHVGDDGTGLLMIDQELGQRGGVAAGAASEPSA